MCLPDPGLPVALHPLLLDAMELVERDQVPTFIPCAAKELENGAGPIVTDYIYCKKKLITEKHDF